MQGLLAVLGAAAGAVSQVCIIAVVGCVGARYPTTPSPLLSPETLRCLSRLANDIFLPALTVAVLGARVDAQALRDDWILLPAGLAVTIFGYAIADLTALLFRPAIAHPNAFALPLLVLRYLCERPAVNEEFDDDAAECVEHAAAKLCVYLTAWHIFFWTYAYSTLEGAAHEEEKAARPWAATAKLWGRRVLLQPNMLAVYVGIAVGASPLRKKLFFGNTWLRPLGLSIQTLGEPVVATTVLIMAAALANGV